jgi:hypothetical protein
MVPPEIDLAEYESVGLIEFKTDAEGTLGPFITQRFLKEISLSQKEARIIELGSMDEVLVSVQRDKLDPEAISAIGEKHNLSALIVGDLMVSDVKPKVSISSIISHMSVKAEVEASMIVKLLETGRGATVWTGTAQQRKNVAHVSIFSPDSIMFDAKDPEQAYGELTESLIEEVTEDLRVSYRRR